ncbi:hypothetical protein H8D30_00975 [bacterium]|nr:hypothetical protein [bacterium]
MSTNNLVRMGAWLFSFSFFLPAWNPEGESLFLGWECAQFVLRALLSPQDVHGLLRALWLNLPNFFVVGAVIARFRGSVKRFLIPGALALFSALWWSVHPTFMGELQVGYYLWVFSLPLLSLPYPLQPKAEK